MIDRREGYYLLYGTQYFSLHTLHYTDGVWDYSISDGKTEVYKLESRAKQSKGGMARIYHEIGRPT